MSEHQYVRAVAGHTAVHYGSHGQAECGADYPNMATTIVPSHVTCRTCRGWLPIVAPELQRRTEAVETVERPTRAELLAALSALVTEFDTYSEDMREIGRGHGDYGKQREEAHILLNRERGEKIHGDQYTITKIVSQTGENIAKCDLPASVFAETYAALRRACPHGDLRIHLSIDSTMEGKK